jgi:predicted DNA-binding transcriptional regulator AlpA
MKIEVTRAYGGISQEQTLDSLQFLRVADICRLLRISKPTFWRLRRTAAFPKPTQLTDRVIGWRKSEVELWLLERSVAGSTASSTRRIAIAVDSAHPLGVSDRPGPYER